MSSKGWVKLHRKIQDHWIYQERRVFSKFEAWIDLIMRTNHKDNKVVLGNELVDIKRGQFITSIRKLCDTWKWSNTKVNGFLKLLEQDGMIAYKSDKKKTVITIVNYELHHDREIRETSQKNHENDTKASQKHTDKNVKNVKNDKELSSSTRDSDFSEAMQFYQSNLQRGLTESPFNLELLGQFYDEHGHDLLMAAMKTAAKAEAKGVNFVEGVLKNWREAGVKTIEDARKHESEFKSKRGYKSEGNNMNKKEGDQIGPNYEIPTPKEGNVLLFRY